MYCHLDKRQPCPFRLRPTETYLGEDANGYYVMDGFFDDAANMFKRMVKFTPKSFKPANLYKGFINTALTAGTFGTYQFLPRSARKVVYDVGKVAVPIIAAGAAAYALGPSVMTMLGTKLSSAGTLLGKAASSVGQTLLSKLTSLSPANQSEIAQQVTPEDIAYAETHNGVYPPNIQQLINKGEEQTYGYSVMNALQPNTIQTPADASFYAPSSLYPGLQQARMEQAAKQDSSQEEGLSSGATIGIAVGGTALLMLLLRK